MKNLRERGLTSIFLTGLAVLFVVTMAAFTPFIHEPVHADIFQEFGCTNVTVDIPSDLKVSKTYCDHYDHLITDAQYLALVQANNLVEIAQFDHTHLEILIGVLVIVFGNFYIWRRWR